MNYSDDDFLNTISKNFDYDLINNELANFAKGIYNLYLIVFRELFHSFFNLLQFTM